jgi:hypothetical protein
VGGVLRGEPGVVAERGGVLGVAGGDGAGGGRGSGDRSAAGGDARWSVRARWQGAGRGISGFLLAWGAGRLLPSGGRRARFRGGRGDGDGAAVDGAGGAGGGAGASGAAEPGEGDAMSLYVVERERDSFDVYVDELRVDLRRQWWPVPLTVPEIRDCNARDGEWHATIRLPHEVVEHEGRAVPAFEGDVERLEWEARRRVRCPRAAAVAPRSGAGRVAGTPRLLRSAASSWGARS